MVYRGLENMSRRTTTPDPCYIEKEKEISSVNFRQFSEFKHHRLLKQMAADQKLRMARESVKNDSENKFVDFQTEIVAKPQRYELILTKKIPLMPSNVEKRILDFIPKKLSDRYEDIIASQMTIAKEQFSISIQKETMQNIMQEYRDRKIQNAKICSRPNKKFLRVSKTLEKKLLITEEPVRAVLDLAARDLPEVVKNFKLICSGERSLASLSFIINGIRREVDEINTFLRWTWYPKVAAALQRQLRKSVLPLNNLQTLLYCIEGLIKREIVRMKQDLLLKLLQLIKDVSCMPMHKLKLEICDRRIELTPNCDALKQTYVRLAYDIVNIGSKKLQCLALEMQLHLNTYGRQHLKLDLDEIFVGEFIGELTDTLTHVYSPVLCHLESFGKRYENLLNDMETKDYEGTPLKIDETFGYIVQYTKFRHMICYEDQTVKLPLCVINVEPALNQLNNIAENLTKYNSNKLVSHHIKLLKEICADYEEFKKRALKKPSSTEELLKLFEFISSVKKTTFVELKRRIKHAKEFGRRVEGVATFTQYHLNLQAKTFNWLHDIHSLYDLSVCQLQRFTLIFQNHLEFVKNKLNRDIEVLIANILTLDKAEHEKKLKKNKAFVENIAIQYNEFLDFVKWINKEERLLKTTTLVTTYPQLEKIRKFLIKFQNNL